MLGGQFVVLLQDLLFIFYQNHSLILIRKEKEKEKEK